MAFLNSDQAGISIWLSDDSHHRRYRTPNQIGRIIFPADKYRFFGIHRHVGDLFQDLFTLSVANKTAS